MVLILWLIVLFVILWCSSDDTFGKVMMLVVIPAVGALIAVLWEPLMETIGDWWKKHKPFK